MKILMINVVCGIRSTGRICTDLASALELQGHEVKIAYGREDIPREYQKYAVRIGSDNDVKLHVLKSRLLDASGFGSQKATSAFIKWIKDYNPDIIHLHNIHGYYINVELLFEYLKTSGKRIIWTLHDCWSFTGHCAYFDYVECSKWKTGCCHCTQKSEYPARIGLDFSKYNYTKKKELFTNVPDLTLVTPSQWLANLLTESYLKEYPTKVIHNGVDTTNFKPVDNNIKEKYHCENKTLLLGVAAVWDRRKGYEEVLKIVSKMDDSYMTILVGLDDDQIDNLPENIIGIKRTNNIFELAELYSAADLFINPTLEDNYPTTNLEAIACGTPVITYLTGGSGESAEMYGVGIKRKDVDGFVEAIKNRNSIQRGSIDVDYMSMVYKYVELYKEI